MILMGHRGARDCSLENTLDSFKHAIALNVPWVEFDIHSTKDGEWIVHHDFTVDRLTNSQGLIKNFTLNEIEKIKHHDGQKIPTLIETLELFKDTKTKLQIEIKSNGDFKKLAQLIQNKIEDFSIISFNHRVLKHMKEIDSHIKTFCLLEGLPINATEVIKSCNADGISLSIKTIDKQLVEECHSKKFIVTTWNANDDESMAFAKSIGVDIIATDRLKYFSN